jgi:CDP-2,3-bis-(O-geranylgeranyl)-sn-glycerol synthase
MGIIGQMWGAVWFMLPAYIGNIIPIFVKNIPIFPSPVHNRLFGNHKTWRGLVIGIIGAGIIALLQIRPLWYGLVLGTGNFTGDLCGAFIKRRLGIPPGGKNLLIDALPSPTIAVLFAWAAGFYTLSVIQTIFILLATIPLHIFFNALWYRIKCKSSPW